MIVNDFDIVRVSRSPAETDPPLRVNPDAVLARPIAPELLQAIARRKAQVVEARGRFEHPQLSESDLLNFRTQHPHRATLEEPFSITSTKALDHWKP